MCSRQHVTQGGGGSSTVVQRIMGVGSVEGQMQNPHRHATAFPPRRQSGASDVPMPGAEAVRFASPPDLALTVALPHAGALLCLLCQGSAGASGVAPRQFTLKSDYEHCVSLSLGLPPCAMSLRVCGSSGPCFKRRPSATSAVRRG